MEARHGGACNLRQHEALRLIGTINNQAIQGLP